MHMYQECIWKYLFYLLNFFYHEHFFFKNWAALKSSVLQVLSNVWLPKIISPFSHSLHHCSSKIQTTSRLRDVYMLEEVFSLTLPPVPPWNLAALHYLLSQTTLMCKGGEWCFMQTWNQGETKNFQFHSWLYKLESREMHVIQVWNVF